MMDGCVMERQEYLLEKAKRDGRESESEGFAHHEERWDWRLDGGVEQADGGKPW